MYDRDAAALLDPSVDRAVMVHGNIKAVENVPSGRPKIKTFRCFDQHAAKADDEIPWPGHAIPAMNRRPTATMANPAVSLESKASPIAMPARINAGQGGPNARGAARVIAKSIRKKPARMW